MCIRGCICPICQRERKWVDAEYFQGMQDRKNDAMREIREAREMKSLWSTSLEFARILSEKSEEKERDISKESWPYKFGYRGVIIGF